MISKDTKRYAMFLSAAIVIVAVVYFLSAGKSKAPTIDQNGIATTTGEAPQAGPPVSKIKTAPAGVAAPKEAAYTVSYGNSGFSPRVLEVKRGTSVRFVNNSTKSLRVDSTDSNNNPVYQTFSQPKSVGRGGYYEYTFNDVGVFEYLNRNNTADRGTITVK